MNLSVKDWLWMTFFFFTVAIIPAIFGATMACWMYHRSKNVSFDDLRVYASAVSNRLDRIEYGFSLIDISVKRKEASYE